MTKKASARTSVFNRFALGDLLNKLMSEDGAPLFHIAALHDVKRSADLRQALRSYFIIEAVVFVSDSRKGTERHFSRIGLHNPIF
jgi:hypothetical protein